MSVWWDRGPYSAVQKHCLFEVSDSRKGQILKQEEKRVCFVCVFKRRGLGVKHGVGKTAMGG